MKGRWSGCRRAFAIRRIVWAKIAGRNGICRQRPAVIVTPTERITATNPLAVVAVTSRVPNDLPADHVLLPWHPQRHPRTGLNRNCAAVCSWLSEITANDIQDVAGVVPGAESLEIVTKIKTIQET